MASVQCCKPVEQRCRQEQHQSHSFGRKVSDMVSSAFKKEQTHQAHCYHQTLHCSSGGMSVTKTTQTHCSCQTSISHTRPDSHRMPNNLHTMYKCNGQGGHSHSHGYGRSGTATDHTKCHGKTRRNNDEHKMRKLLRKIKDSISGNSDSGSSSSSSESDSDDCRCGRKKN